MPLHIRAPHAHELDRLRAIEVDAAQRFLEVGKDELAAMPPQTRDALERARVEGRLWLAELDGVPVGMALTALVDGELHLAELDVALAHQRRGIGRALLEHVIRSGREAGLAAITLNTFRDVPWNGPYYARLGFEEISRAQMGPELAAATAVDEAHFGASQRVCMRRRLTGGAALGPPSAPEDS